MTTINENQKYFYNSKSEYLEMRKKWAEFVNGGNTVYPEHHMIYNILRGKDMNSGFTPFVRESKIKNLIPAHIHAKQNIREFQKNHGKGDYYSRYLDKYIKPFKFSEEQLRRLYSYDLDADSVPMNTLAEAV